MKRRILALVFGCIFLFIYLLGIGVVLTQVSHHFNQSPENEDFTPLESDSTAKVLIKVSGGCLLGLIPGFFIGFFWCDPASQSALMEEEKKNNSIIRFWIALSVFPAVFFLYFPFPAMIFIDLISIAGGMFSSLLIVSNINACYALEPSW
jgi:hypothetical protein